MSQPLSYFPGLRFLHSPGPTHVPKAVMDAMSEQPMDMADERLDPLIADCEEGLRSIMKSDDAEVFIYSSNGHGVWEAVTVNLASPGQKVLVASTGHFSDSWALMTEAMGVEVVRTPYREGYPIDPADIEQALGADRANEIVAVYVVQTDTASSITSDVPAIREAMNRAGHPALLVVDVVASLAAAPYGMDAWGVDVTLGASQKGLMCPPGMAFCAANARAIEVARANPANRFYWDWERRRGAPSYKKFCGTPPQSFLQGLRTAISLLHQEGLDNVLARHRRFAAAVQAAVEVWAEGGQMQFICQIPSARSVSVTTIEINGVAPDMIRQVAREQFNVSLAGGLGPFFGRAFRIGHLGDLSAPMVLGCLSAVEGTLRSLQVPIGSGAINAALDALKAQ
ncbi:MAG: aminotransferase class V-fold PLP-dependent enzyme [Burkholderiaceae bacterium]|nr:aminotransferase class V-fold PLP-dependent enzyme [Burkholderiaceae bacterium]MCD8536778.1 aminotransferase class V-fold PLP-dependent enzyme [Burkholderiaceae bacterium]MCD8565652.1 aminotransferase class V-fold PLP-dependent enzyme [Burkholderiaceae bacterium]